MRPRRVLTLLVLVAGLTGALCGWAGATAAAAPPARAAAVTHLLVYAQEWSLWPSRSWVPAGTIIVELWNRGQDAHDVTVRRLNSHGRMVGRAQAVGVTQSGQIRTGRWHLGPGKYELYCSMPGHMKLGMHARLTVR